MSDTLHMYCWSVKPNFIAVAQAKSVEHARQLLIEQIGESGDGSCPERDYARKDVLGTTPTIWHFANAEFALTDSAELREQDEHVKRLETALREKDAHLDELHGVLGELSNTPSGEIIRRLEAQVAEQAREIARLQESLQHMREALALIQGQRETRILELERELTAWVNGSNAKVFDSAHPPKVGEATSPAKPEATSDSSFPKL